MRRIVILTGVLGGGTALTFAAAALAATAFPNGTVVTAGWSSGGWVQDGVRIKRNAAIPVPGPFGDATGGAWIQPNDVVVTLDTP